MTIPFERTRSILQTRDFLERLLNPRETPRVPRSVRGQAKTLLRHFPNYSDIELVHQALPDWYGPVPPFSRMRGSAQTDAIVEVSTLSANGDALKGRSDDKK